MNLLRFLSLSLLVGACMLPLSAAHAQGATQAIQQLSALNRINPMQNPAYDTADEVLNRKIVDRTNKVVGEIKDINIRENGTIDTIAVDFDRLALSGTVYLNFREMRMRTTDSSFELAMNSDEIENVYPELLSNIETASGGEDAVYSMKKLDGVNVSASDGRNLGKVKDILFSSRGNSVVALFVELTHGINRGETMAIPFRETTMKTKTGRLYAEVNEALADAMLEMADQ